MSVTFGMTAMPNVTLARHLMGKVTEPTRVLVAILPGPEERGNVTSALATRTTVTLGMTIMPSVTLAADGARSP